MKKISLQCAIYGNYVCSVLLITIFYFYCIRSQISLGKMYFFSAAAIESAIVSIIETIHDRVRYEVYGLTRVHNLINALKKTNLLRALTNNNLDTFSSNTAVVKVALTLSIVHCLYSFVFK